MLKTKAGEQEIMDYLAKLIGTLAIKEQELRKALISFLNSSERGEDPVVRDSTGRVISEVEVANYFYYLHYANTPASFRAMRRPTEHEHEIKTTILKKMEILKALRISFEMPSPNVRQWLGIEEESCY